MVNSFVINLRSKFRLKHAHHRIRCGHSSYWLIERFDRTNSSFDARKWIRRRAEDGKHCPMPIHRYRNSLTHSLIYDFVQWQIYRCEKLIIFFVDFVLRRCRWIHRSFGHHKCETKIEINRKKREKRKSQTKAHSIRCRSINEMFFFV